MTKAGAVLGDDGRLRFSKSLVEDMIALSSKDLTLFGREEKLICTCLEKVFLELQEQPFMWSMWKRKNTETQQFKTYITQLR